MRTATASLKFTEIIDAPKLQKLMANWEALPLREDTFNPTDKQKWDPRKICEGYLADAENGRVVVKYKKSPHADGTGRWFAKGLQSMPREIRHTIAAEFYIDIDMKNAHPMLLQQYCLKAEIPCPALTDYVMRRDEIFREICETARVDKAEVKTAFLALTNGGRGSQQLRGHPTLMRYKKEMDAIHGAIVAREQRFLEMVQKKGKTTNVYGSVVNMLLCDLENTVLMAMVDFLKERGLFSGQEVLVFDGMMIPKAAAQSINLHEVEAYVFEHTGYRVILVEKPMDEVIDIDRIQDRRANLPMSELANAQLNEHDELAKVAAQLAGGCIAFAGKSAFVFNQLKKRWVEDRDYVEVKRFLLDKVAPAIQDAASKYNEAWRMSQSAELSDKENNLREHAKALKNARHIPKIIDMMQIHLQDTEIRERLDSNPYLLGFNNGVYNLRTMELEEARPEHMISLTTGYDFPLEASCEATEYVKKFLRELFDNEQDLEYLLKVMASCLDGTRRFEEFYILTGAGRNGKGTLMTLINKVMGEYYSDMAAEFWTRPRKDSSSPLPELVNKVGRRICNSSEPEAGDAPLQAAKLKMFSGRDPVSCRPLYGQDFTYMPQFGIFIQTNDIPTLNKVDQGVSNRLRIIQFPHQFLPEGQVSMDHHRKQDPSLKERFQSDSQVRNAFLLLLLEKYAEVSQMESIPMPARLQQVCQEYIDESNPVLKFLEEGFVITNKAEDVVSAATLWAEFSGRNKNYTQTMFGRLMEAAGVVKANSRLQGKMTRVYRGLKRRNLEGDDSESDQE